jgi:hypothetical protein
MSSLLLFVFLVLGEESKFLLNQSLPVPVLNYSYAIMPVCARLKISTNPLLELIGDSVITV